MFGRLSYNATPPGQPPNHALACAETGAKSSSVTAAISNWTFTPQPRRSYFAVQFDAEDLRGLDLFHNRFAPDPRRNPSSRTVVNQFSDKLERLEEGQK